MDGEEHAQTDEAGKVLIFVIVEDPEERETMRSLISDMGFAAVGINSVRAAIALLGNGAQCDLVVLSTNAMKDDPANFDLFVDGVNSPPPIVIYGADRNAKLVLHCLNRGARDFLTRPLDKEEFAYAVDNIVGRERTVGRNSQPPDAIFGENPVANWIELTASSALEQFRRLQRFSDSLFGANFPPDVREDLKLAVEEVGRNAVEWGNRFDPDKRIHVSYAMFDDRLVIKVEDEGEGFSPQLVPDPTADPMKVMRERQSAGKRPGGYGVYLIQKLVDDIVYNEKGNTVLLIKYLPKKNGDRPAR